MIDFPKTPKTYIDFWKTLASKNKDIRHDESSSKQFALINKSADPFGGKWDLSEFNDGKNSKIRMLYSEGNYCLALVNCDFECSPTMGVQNIKTLQGAFLVLTKVSPGKLEDRDNAFNSTFLIGEQLINWFAEYLNQNRGIFSGFKYGTEHVIDPEGIIGTAYIFDYGIRTGICFDTANFGGFTPQNS